MVFDPFLVIVARSQVVDVAGPLVRLSAVGDVGFLDDDDVYVGRLVFGRVRGDEPGDTAADYQNIRGINLADRVEFHISAFPGV